MWCPTVPDSKFQTAVGILLKQHSISKERYQRPNYNGDFTPTDSNFLNLLHLSSKGSAIQSACCNANFDIWWPQRTSCKRYIKLLFSGVFVQIVSNFQKKCTCIVVSLDSICKDVTGSQDSTKYFKPKKKK